MEKKHEMCFVAEKLGTRIFTATTAGRTLRATSPVTHTRTRDFRTNDDSLKLDNWTLGEVLKTPFSHSARERVIQKPQTLQIFE